MFERWVCFSIEAFSLTRKRIDRTVRSYSFPDLNRQFVFGAHRAAVNAVSISKSLIVSGSGDRSIRLWDAESGKLLRTFENHHSRGIASIDFVPPLVVSGSSDKHLRLFDISNSQGWSTCPPTPFLNYVGCQTCGGMLTNVPAAASGDRMHEDLVRSVALGDEFVLSGSYDLSIKVSLFCPTFILWILLSVYIGVGEKDWASCCRS